MLAQILANTLIRAAELGMLAVGVTMVFSVLRFANFAHGELALVGCYIAFALATSLGLPIVVAGAGGILVAGLIAVASDKVLFRRLRSRPGLTLLMGSFGLGIFIRYLVAAIWGVTPQSFPYLQTSSYQFFGAYVTSTQLWMMFIAVMAMITFHAFIHHTRLGKALRALSDNRELAQARGIDIEKIITWLWFIVGCYAGLGGVLIGLETILTPEMGYSIMLAVFAAAILGGIGSLSGALLGALLIAFAENAVVALDWSAVISVFGLIPIDGPLYVPTGYKIAVPLVILGLVLLFMPRGIMKGSSGD